jgi:membrane protein YdbS with pleckstrin-like domain
MTPDFINGVFEFVGSVALWRNVLQLQSDRVVRGVHWMATGFFMLWGYWNLFYYPHLNQWWSLAGGVSIVVANTVWLLQMVHYLRRGQFA